MNIENMDHLNLTVADFDATVKWYHEVFGFALVEAGIRHGKRWGVLQAERALLCIYEHNNRKVPNLDREKLHGVNHFSFRIRNKTEWENTVLQLDLQLEYGGLVRYPHSDSWYVIDPTGYEIEIVHWDRDEIHFG